ncbi:cation-transporting ATPase 13A1 [Fistulifera solaris]|uniref:Cation-transporting ATPase 13A1 n=1 Tax=Fistulifera solaris TaxID=1519565 RepID=A0A1Z5KIL5_FISSO|nr:cation-transporting ATPase 13A1 [Fistulifera solaris]|eukprot:GAX25788.1 cation-transporting ATPase 13A1 [Fistulifera solaris]
MVGCPTDSKGIRFVQVYQAKLAAGGKSKIRLYNVIFIVLYVIQTTIVLSTVGEPYRKFLEKADQEGFQVMEGATKLRAQFEHSFHDLDDPNRRIKKIGWMDWMDMDIEELAAEKKRDKEQSVLDALPKSMRVPNKYAASFWPSLFLGILATLHALLLLMQHWSVGFNVWVNFQEVDATVVEIPAEMMALPEEEEIQSSETSKEVIQDRRIYQVPSHLPTHARICPAKGHHVLVELEYYPTLGMTFEYHRRRYVFENDMWTKVRCRTDLLLSQLQSYQGLNSTERVAANQIRYGPNLFNVKSPSFLELYKKQLLNPFSVFQIFCVLLWAIDDYLIYSFFSLFIVLMFEGTVVFQRIKSMQALRGMGNPSRHIYVYRAGAWSITDTTKLLPGDIVSLTRKVNKRDTDDGGDVVPADLLLLRGSTVVNEASLTGESVPQMKEGLAELPNEALSMKGNHKMNVAFAGTKMLQCKGGVDYIQHNDSSTSFSGVPLPPDGGCVCFVLRTGFASAQGKLVRMIEGSQEKVKGHEYETGLLLLFLCFFAVISSGYVLYHGAKNENRSKYELLLHCIMIVTNVIRPELPMQMAMAVNNSLMTLMKMHIFCTEPYKVPVAGKLDACLFDKTGTLTTDELVAVGVCEPDKLKLPDSAEEDDLLKPMTQVTSEAGFVLAGCHTLVVVDDETQGDPLESAAIASMRWHVSSMSGKSVPKDATKKKPAGKPFVLGDNNKVTEVEILSRHHFSSKLQRMSCVVDTNAGLTYAVAKGSPEAIGQLLSSKPDGYDAKAQYLSKQGFRLIALAFKELSSKASVKKAIDSRAVCESQLVFAGFIAFTCKVRKDTARVLQHLKEGGMSVAMVTGDALLTAIHVAKEVNICEPIGNTEKEDIEEENEELRAFLESKRNGSIPSKKRKEKKKAQKLYKPIAFLEKTGEEKLLWRSYNDGSKVADFVSDEIPNLSKKYDLATTGKCLATAFEQDSGTKKVLQFIKVFARMAPDEKEQVIECLHGVGALCLMCGDGANDVGALKQADVGVALLSGFGNMNVEKENGVETENTKETSNVTAIMSQEHLEQIRSLPTRVLKMKIRSIGVDPDKYPELKEKEDLVQLYQIKAREIAVKRHDAKNEKDKKNMTQAEKKAEQRRVMMEKQRRMQERAEELAAQGESFASFKALKEFMAAEREEAKKKAAQLGGVEGSAASLAAQFEELDAGETPVVKLGDASMAAPFTSKMPSIQSCVDIVRQGRCTLVSSIQMYQIMALQCLISSYSLSALYLDGVKYGDTQMTAMGLLGSVSFMSVSRSKPLDKLSSVRPLTSIFHPALFCSLLAQFAVHLGTLYAAVSTAKTHLPPDYDAELDGTFKPGILNTVVFLVSSVQQVTVFFVNLQGRPFMTGVTENRPLLWSLTATFVLTFMFASESVPGLNRYFQLVPFPDEGFRNFILTILAMDLVATFLLDRLMKFFFCRHILVAGFAETSMKDVWSLLKTFAIIGFIMHAFMGNSDQWDLMLEMERNATLNITEGNGMDSLDVFEACAGAACESIQAATDAVREEL